MPALGAALLEELSVLAVRVLLAHRVTARARERLKLGHYLKLRRVAREPRLNVLDPIPTRCQVMACLS